MLAPAKEWSTCQCGTMDSKHQQKRSPGSTKSLMLTVHQLLVAADCGVS